MKKTQNLSKVSCICLLALALGACASNPMSASTQAKPGFSNISDVPIPKSAEMILNKSMVMGGGDTWTGHLAYKTNRSPKEVIDFVNDQMQARGWTKASELRGNESVITFIKRIRVATVRITEESNYFMKDTFVTIDMANSNIKNIMINAARENHHADEEDNQ